MSTALLTSVFSHPARKGVYLFVRKSDQLHCVPDSLGLMFQQKNHVMDLLLTPERSLACADVNQVMEQIKTQGYFLRLPPSTDPANWN